MAPNTSSQRRNSWSRLVQWGIPISVVVLLVVFGLAATSRADGLSVARGSTGDPESAAWLVAARGAPSPPNGDREQYAFYLALPLLGLAILSFGALALAGWRWPKDT
jgi:hypothetical protein